MRHTLRPHLAVFLFCIYPTLWAFTLTFTPLFFLFFFFFFFVWEKWLGGVLLMMCFHCSFILLSYHTHHPELAGYVLFRIFLYILYPMTNGRIYTPYCALRYSIIPTNRDGRRYHRVHSCKIILFIPLKNAFAKMPRLAQLQSSIWWPNQTCRLRLDGPDHQ